MPEGVPSMTFRPENLPQKTEEEKKEHQRLVDENRKMYIRKIKEKNEKEVKRKKDVEEKERKQQMQREIWELDVLPNWDTLKRTKRVRELWVEGIPH